MKNYRDSDYAANKYADGIVYCSVTGTITVTLADYLAENPDKTEADFAELKALSDEDYLERDRDEYRRTWKDVSIHSLEETDACCVPSAEAQVIDVPDQAAKEKRRRKLARQALDTLTETQRRRYIQYHVDGLSTREIAAAESAHFTTVHESLQVAERKIKQFLGNG